MAGTSGMSGRSSNWSFEEIAILTDFVRLNKEKLVGTSSKGKACANVEKVKKNYWELASRVLVESGCHSRPWEKIRKKWQTVRSHARAYHREINKTGGGVRPASNKVFDKVLEALSPVAKDGIQNQEDGESNPLPRASTTEAAFDLITNAIVEGTSIEQEDDDDEDNEDDEDDEEESEVGQIPQAANGKQQTKKPTVMDIEIQRLELDKERMRVDREHLEVFRQISGSLQEISQNFQVFLNALKDPKESEA